MFEEKKNTHAHLICLNTFPTVESQFSLQHCDFLLYQKTHTHSIICIKVCNPYVRDAAWHSTKNPLILISLYWKITVIIFLCFFLNYIFSLLHFDSRDRFCCKTFEVLWNFIKYCCYWLSWTILIWYFDILHHKTCMDDLFIYKKKWIQPKTVKLHL